MDSHVGENGTWTAGLRASKSRILVGNAKGRSDLGNVASLPASVNAAVAVAVAGCSTDCYHYLLAVSCFFILWYV